jgi:hypothetical protein
MVTDRCNNSNHWHLFMIFKWWGYRRKWRKGIAKGPLCYFILTSTTVMKYGHTFFQNNHQYIILHERWVPSRKAHLSWFYNAKYFPKHNKTLCFCVTNSPAMQWRTEWWGGGRFTPPPLPESPIFFTKTSRIPIRNNLIRIRVSLICKLSGTPD